MTTPYAISGHGHVLSLNCPVVQGLAQSESISESKVD
jgi:hypothetical protein